MSIHLVHQESKNLHWSIVNKTSSQSLNQSTYQPLSFRIVLNTPMTSSQKTAYKICLHLVWIGTVPRSRSCRAEWHASPPTSLLPSWFPTSCSLLSSASTSTSCSTSPSYRSWSRRSYCGTSTKWNLTPSHRYIQKGNLLIELILFNHHYSSEAENLVNTTAFENYSWLLLVTRDIQSATTKKSRE